MSVYSPALRTVNVVGNPVRGPLDLRIVQSSPLLIVANVLPPEYAAENQSDWLDFNYSKRWDPLGVRVIVRIQFSALFVSDPSSGLSLIQSYWEDGVNSGSFAALQFNLFYLNPSSAWRGIYPTTPWNPTLHGSKETSSTGYEYTFEAVGVDVLPVPVGRMHNQTW